MLIKRQINASEFSLVCCWKETAVYVYSLVSDAPLTMLFTTTCNDCFAKAEEGNDHNDRDGRIYSSYEYDGKPKKCQEKILMLQIKKEFAFIVMAYSLLKKGGNIEA